MWCNSVSFGALNKLIVKCSILKSLIDYLCLSPIDTQNDIREHFDELNIIDDIPF